MRPLIRSLFLLSLTASPLALAANSAPEALASATVVSATSSSASVERSSEDVALVATEVRDLETTIDGLRREVSLLQEQDDARTFSIGDPNVHSLWP
jgi:TolA-binding protein